MPDFNFKISLFIYNLNKQGKHTGFFFFLILILRFEVEVWTREAISMDTKFPISA